MKYDCANPFPANRCAHRRVLSKKKDYIPIQNAVLECINTKDAESYESTVLDIRQDPLVVTINGYCRLIQDDETAKSLIKELYDGFDDSSLVFNENGRRCVKVFDLFSSSKDKLEKSGIKNQYELAALLAYFGNDISFETVYLPEIPFKQAVKEKRLKQESLNTENFAITYFPELSDMVLRYLEKHNGSFVNIVKIRNELGIRHDTLVLILNRLAEEKKVTLNEDMAKFGYSESKPASAYALDDLSEYLRKYLQKFRGKHVSFVKVCKDLNININLLQWLMKNVADKDSYDVNSDGIMLKIRPDAVIDKQSTEPTEQSQNNSNNEEECVRLIKNYLSDKEERQITTFELSRMLKIPDYSVDLALDELSKDRAYSVNAYGITKLGTGEILFSTDDVHKVSAPESEITKKSVTQKVLEETHNEEPAEIGETGTVSMEPLECKETRNISEKSMDRMFIKSLFDGNMDYLPLSKIIAAYYRSNRKSQVDASEIMNILTESPYVVSFKNQYRPVYCSFHEFDELFKGSGYPEEKSDFVNFFNNNRQSFTELGMNNSDEAYQIYTKRRIISETEKEKPAVSESEKTVIEKSVFVKTAETNSLPDFVFPHPVKKKVEIDQSVLDSDLIDYVRKIMRDGNKRSAYYLRNMISRIYDKSYSQEEISKVLIAMNQSLELVRDSPDTYRNPGRTDILSKAESIIDDLSDCIFSSIKLYQNRMTKWESIGITEPYEVFDIVTRLDRVSVVMDDIISFDGCEPSAMIYDKKYSKETLLNYYGIPMEWVKLRRF